LQEGVGQVLNKFAMGGDDDGAGFGAGGVEGMVLIVSEN
jgi:hypothetical protein